MTGYTTEDVLEAAHISPHRGTHTNVVANGLLLRADIHTLFNVHLLTITTDMRVRVSPALKDSPYMDLDNQPLQSRPDSPDQLPRLRSVSRDITRNARGTTMSRSRCSRACLLKI